MKFPPGYVPGSGVHKASGFGGFGERLLRKQGWEKGEGLGKNKTGVAEAIQVKKKEDSAGVKIVLPYHAIIQTNSAATVHRLTGPGSAGWSKQKAHQL
jgi:hypothetical protein